MNRQFTYRSGQVADTQRLAQALASRLSGGSVIVLDGDLGAGKTTFSKAFAAGMGVQEMVNSPTFTLIKEYEGAERPFYHMDVYRLSLEEADELGLDEYFESEGITLVEWGLLIEELLPETYLHIHIAQTDIHQRMFTLTPFGSPFDEICEALTEAGVLNK
ncbi:tRNA (adenosine(37)-N6)-threonylcarbamoyltransferase complex ATPase subunit type 1 TsaE [Marinicrinis sediminis]|uniref:tRNA threonylcarbamoyladenosine biosynthesis protein TsaE n=1 Tax=Marinicrinis sediminis TaxID=1652465 RepID=A0ABW5R7J0_9BACL